MSKPNYTHITLVLDASSSMSKFNEDMRIGVTNFLHEQEQVVGDATVSMNIFSDNISSRVLHFADISEAREYFNQNFYTGGGTSLYDAVYSMAQDVATRINSLRDDYQPEKVIFAIVTDGCDYNSRNHRPEDVKVLVDHFESVYEWEFLYVGANQNAYSVGKAFGIKAGKALSWAASEEGLTHAMEAISGAVTRYRENGAPHADQFFTVEDHNFQREHGAAAAPVSSES